MPQKVCVSCISLYKDFIPGGRLPGLMGKPFSEMSYLSNLGPTTAYLPAMGYPLPQHLATTAITNAPTCPETDTKGSQLFTFNSSTSTFSGLSSLWVLFIHSDFCLSQLFYKRHIYLFSPLYILLPYHTSIRSKELFFFIIQTFSEILSKCFSK